MRILTVNAQVLLAVLEDPEKTQKEIAKDLDMNENHVWRALERLINEGYLVKKRIGRRSYFFATDNLHEIEDLKRLKACLLNIEDRQVNGKNTVLRH